MPTKTFTVKIGGKQFCVERDEDGKFILPDELKAWRSHKSCALKPAWEPILCFRAPNGGKTYAELALAHGSGALNVDGGRIGITKRVPGSISQAKTNERCYGDYGLETGEEDGHNPNVGRYPANLAFECTCETVEIVDAADGDGHFPAERKRGKDIYGFGGNGEPAATPGGERYMQGKAIRHTNPECPAFILDAQAGELASGGYPPEGGQRSHIATYGKPTERGPQQFGASTGGPSRFYYCAKASRGEREEGLEEFAEVSFAQSNGAKAAIARGESEYAEAGEEFGANVIKSVRNDHPTVKPIDLNKWLAGLLLPPDSVKPRRLLVPFAGSGSEIIGALAAGWDEVVGIEQDRHYAEIAQARIAHWDASPVVLERREAQEVVRTVKTPAQGGLF